MSSQSGISVSPELAKEFPGFVSSNAIAAILKLSNEKEHVELERQVEGTLEHVQEQLAPGTEARYVALRDPNDSSSFLFVQFMPDNAPLSSKMKYASSHATIHRQLGGSSTFTTSIFWTDLDEVSSKGLNAHFAHESAPAPMTEEEENLATAVELEKAHGTTGRSVANQATLAVNASVSPKAKSAISDLKDGNALLFTVESDDKETVDLAAECNASDLASEASNSDGPRYVVATVDSVSIFAFVCPRSSSIKQRMLFASTRIAFHNWLKSEIKIGPSIETYDPEEDLKLSSLKDVAAEENKDSKQGEAKHESVVQKPRFSRPKPPRRR